MHSHRIDHQIDKFYSEPTASWLRVLGERGHYHFGRTNPDDPTEHIMDYAVRALYPFIPDGSSILDCGCGWGGPAKLFVREKRCKVTGVTTASQQYEFIKKNIKEIEVVHADLHEYIPDKHFACGLIIETLAHLPNPRKLFANLFPKVGTIVLVEFFAKTRAMSNLCWHLHFQTRQEIVNMLRASGYALEHFEETLTLADVRKTAEYWLDGLSKLQEDEIVGHLKHLRELGLMLSKQREELDWSIGLFYAVK